VIAKIIDGLGLRARIPVIVHGDDRCWHFSDIARCLTSVRNALKGGRASNATVGPNPTRDTAAFGRSAQPMLLSHSGWLVPGTCTRKRLRIRSAKRELVPIV
jgi:hypothetical protein